MNILIYKLRNIKMGKKNKNIFNFLLLHPEKAKSPVGKYRIFIEIFIISSPKIIISPGTIVISSGETGFVCINNCHCLLGNYHFPSGNSECRYIQWSFYPKKLSFLQGKLSFHRKKLLFAGRKLAFPRRKS
jgi:hypothetical protein